MFRATRVEVDFAARETNRLAIRFRSLAPRSPRSGPRPRWKTALVKEQNLRWFRTTLLGRIPGWSPADRARGPWRAIALEWRCDRDRAPRPASARGGRACAAACAPVQRPVEEARIVLDERGPRASAAGTSNEAIEIAEAALVAPHAWRRPTSTVPLEVKVAASGARSTAARVGFKEIRVRAATAGGDGRCASS
jgi:beta-mannosidase